jgi:hypothetical protein
VDKDEKSYLSSPYWKWEFDYTFDFKELNIVQGFIRELEEKYGLEKERDYYLFPNIQEFVKEELWDAVIIFLIEFDTYYFDEEIDADLFKVEIYDLLDVNKAVDKEQKHFFDAIDDDIEFLREILLEEVEEVGESTEIVFDEKKQNEIKEKINFFLGEENVR